MEHDVMLTPGQCCSHCCHTGLGFLGWYCCVCVQEGRTNFTVLFTLPPSQPCGMKLPSYSIQIFKGWWKVMEKWPTRF